MAGGPGIYRALRLTMKKRKVSRNKQDSGADISLEHERDPEYAWPHAELDSVYQPVSARRIGRHAMRQGGREAQ
jgi:hypothetical protein